MEEQKKVFTPEESTELLHYIATNMATKGELDEIRMDLDDMRTNMVTKVDLEEAENRIKTDLTTELRKEIKASEQRVMDYTDRRVAQAEGKIIGFIRKEDEKVDEHIRATEASGAISTKESQHLQQLGPFPKLKAM